MWGGMCFLDMKLDGVKADKQLAVAISLFGIIEISSAEPKSWARQSEVIPRSAFRLMVVSQQVIFLYASD